MRSNMGLNLDWTKKFSILIIFQISSISASAQLKIVPETCQGKTTNSGPILTELNNCQEHAPPDASLVCMELCVLHNRAFIGDSGISETGMIAYIEETFPSSTWDQFKKEFKRCSSKYIEEDSDTQCLKSERFTTCLEDVTEVICTLAPPPQVVQAPPPPPPPPAPQQFQAAPNPMYNPHNPYYPGAQQPMAQGYNPYYKQPPPPPPPRKTSCIIGFLGVCIG